MFTETKYYTIEDLQTLLGLRKPLCRKTIYTYINQNKLPKPEKDKHFGRSVWLKAKIHDCEIAKRLLP